MEKNHHNNEEFDKEHHLDNVDDVVDHANDEVRKHAPDEHIDANEDQDPNRENSIVYESEENFQDFADEVEEDRKSSGLDDFKRDIDPHVRNPEERDSIHRGIDALSELLAESNAEELAREEADKERKRSKGEKSQRLSEGEDSQNGSEVLSDFFDRKNDTSETSSLQEGHDNNDEDEDENLEEEETSKEDDKEEEEEEKGKEKDKDKDKEKDKGKSESGVNTGKRIATNESGSRSKGGGKNKKGRKTPSKSSQSTSKSKPVTGGGSTSKKLSEGGRGAKKSNAGKAAAKKVLPHIAAASGLPGTGKKKASKSNPFSGKVSGTQGDKRPGSKGSSPQNQKPTKSNDASSKSDAGVIDSQSKNSPNEDIASPQEINEPRSRSSRNKMATSQANPDNNLPERNSPSFNISPKSASSSIAKKSGKAVAALLTLAMVLGVATVMGLVTIAGNGRSHPGDLSYAEKELITRSKCTLDDSGGESEEDEGSSKGKRGVPKGEIAKPALMGEPGTKDTDGSGGHAVYTSFFGMRDNPTGSGPQLHAGVDISTLEPDTELYSTNDGTVIFSGCVQPLTENYGCQAIISHEDEDMGEYLTLFGHAQLDSLKVDSGDEVSAGQEIAFMGSTGDSTAQHLHFEVKEISDGQNGKDMSKEDYYNLEAMDPKDYVEEGINADSDKDFSSASSNIDDKDKDKDKDKGKDNKEGEDKDKDKDKKEGEDRDNKDDNEKDKEKDKDKEDKEEGDQNKKGKKRSIKGNKTTKLINAAKEHVGKTRYSFGGGGKDGPSVGQDGNVGFDCSSLMMYAYAQVGIDIPRSTQGQKDAGDIIWDRQRDGGELPVDKLRPGDLILIYPGISHVGMYIGDGKILHASQSGVPLDQQILIADVKTGGGPPERVVRIDDSIAGGSVDSDDDGGESGRTDASFDNCDCESGETARSEHKRTEGQNNPQEPETNYETNADLIISIGEERGMKKEEILLALALADQRSGLANLGNENEEGAEVIDGDEITSSINHSPEGTTEDSSGGMGLFMLPAGKSGTVDEIMDKEWSVNYIYDKMDKYPGNVTSDNWNEVAQSFDIGKSNPQDFKKEAEENFGKFSKKANKDKENSSSDDDDSDKSDSKSRGKVKKGSKEELKTAKWLPEVLDEFGVETELFEGWETRHNGRAEFPNGIQGVVAHHTGLGVGAEYIARHPMFGGSPASQIFLDEDGVAHVVASGVATHAGMGEHEGWPTDNANGMSIGIEAYSGGIEPWPAEQMDAYYRIVAAILTKIGKDATTDSIISHAEYSNSRQGKWDPGAGTGVKTKHANGEEEGYQLDMDKFRENVQAYIDAYKDGNVDSADIDLDFEGIEGARPEGKGKKSNSDRDVCSSDVKEKDSSKKKKYSADLDDSEIPEEYVDLIIEAAEKTDNITPPMLASILYIESGFRPNVGNSLASGIAAFTPESWATWGEGGDIWNPEDAIPASARFLDHLYKHSEDVLEENGGNGDDVLELMAASYNGGPGCILEQACGTPAKVPNCGDPSNFSSYAGQTYPYAKKKFPEAMEKFSK